MLMPVLMIPSFVTCSLCMTAQPELTRRQSAGLPHRRLVFRLLGAALALGLAAMLGVYLMAPVFSGLLYREPMLLPLLRRSCPLVPVMALCQVASGLMNALGLQGASLRISLAASFLSVLLMYALCAQAQLQLWGMIIALAASQLLTLLLSLRALLSAVR